MVRKTWNFGKESSLSSVLDEPVILFKNVSLLTHSLKMQNQPIIITVLCVHFKNNVKIHIPTKFRYKYMHLHCIFNCWWHLRLMVQKSAIITRTAIRAVDRAHADDIFKSSWLTGPIFKPESCLDPTGYLSPSTFLSLYSPINKCCKTPISKIKKRGGTVIFSMQPQLGYNHNT